MNPTKKAQVLEKLEKLKQEYRAHLPGELDAIRSEAQCLGESPSQTKLTSLHRRLHKLAGSAGSFGLSELSARARALELILQDWMDGKPPAYAERQALAEDLNKLGASSLVTPKVHARGSGHTAVYPGEHRNLVYLIEDDASVARELRLALDNFGYQVRHFPRLDLAEEAILAKRPDFLIVDIMFAEENRQGPESIARLQALHEDPLSVVFVSSRNDFDAHLAAVRAGAVGYFVKPLDIPEVIDCLESHLNLYQAAPYRVLIVDDDALLAERYKLVLEGAGMLVEAVTDPRLVLKAMNDFHPEVVLLDLNLPGCRGYELAQLIRLNPDWLRVAIAYLSSEQDEMQQVQAIRHGGEDFLTKPISDLRLVSAVSVRAARSRQLSDAIDRDSLTGLLKHARIKEQVNIELERAARQGKPVSVAMIDLDHFKDVNDTYGHAVGDRVIRALSQLLRQRLRKTDSIGRYGGEEFVAILPDCDQQSACELLNAIRESFAALNFSVGDKVFSVTLSAGVATSSGAWKTNMLEAADQALYRAKDSGRNRVAAADNSAG